MRRIAKFEYCRFLPTIVWIISALVLSVPAYAKTKAQYRVLIKLTENSKGNQLKTKYSLNVKKSVTRGTGALLVVEDIPLGQLKQNLKNEAGIEWMVDDKIIPMD